MLPDNLYTKATAPNYHQTFPVPEKLLMDPRTSPGVFFGSLGQFGAGKYAGKPQEKMLLGGLTDLKAEVTANIEQGLRNQLILFATDPSISHAFRGQREGANCFTWDDLDNYCIFLRIPADRLEAWGGAINLMDEFPRFGKLTPITAALATLRSKGVNLFLAVQSIAQLDRIYGESERRVILDNCQFQAVLRANDADTRREIASLIRTRIYQQRGASEHLDRSMEVTGYSIQANEAREWTVQPHELATLKDVLLLTPDGFFQLDKFAPCNNPALWLLLSGSETFAELVQDETARSVLDTPLIALPYKLSAKRNDGARRLTIDKRLANAKSALTPVCTNNERKQGPLRHQRSQLHLRKKPSGQLHWQTLL